MRTRNLVAIAGLLSVGLGTADMAAARDDHRDPPSRSHHDRYDHARGHDHDRGWHGRDRHRPRSDYPWHCNAYKLRHHIRCHD